jgi:DNA invertase Pin-like site-specific DNA recombinase
MRTAPTPYPSKLTPEPRRPIGRLLINVLATVAEFETDLVRSRTREGMQDAKAKGHLRVSSRS